MLIRRLADRLVGYLLSKGWDGRKMQASQRLFQGGFQGHADLGSLAITPPVPLHFRRGSSAPRSLSASDPKAPDDATSVRAA